MAVTCFELYGLALECGRLFDRCTKREPSARHGRLPLPAPFCKTTQRSSISKHSSTWTHRDQPVLSEFTFRHETHWRGNPNDFSVHGELENVASADFRVDSEPAAIRRSRAGGVPGKLMVLKRDGLNHRTAGFARHTAIRQGDAAPRHQVRSQPPTERWSSSSDFEGRPVSVKGKSLYPLVEFHDPKLLGTALSTFHFNSVNCFVFR